MRLQRTLAELAELVGGRLEGDGRWVVERLLGPAEAGPEDLAVIFRGEPPAGCRAGALIVSEEVPASAAGGPALVRVPAPEQALDELAGRLAPGEGGPAVGCHPTAVVEEGATVDASAALGAHVFVASGARIGADCVLWPGVFVGADAVLGAGCTLRARVVVEARCELGRRVTVHAGAVLGADGFGYREERGRFVKSPQVGQVIIGDDVEIGANTTIDRARLTATVIGPRTKIDDGVHVAHNCRVGADCALAGQVALAGGAVLGDGVRMGGRSGTTDGVTLAAGTIVGGCAVVMKDVEKPGLLLGHPARPAIQWHRRQAAVARLPELIGRLKAVEGAHGP